MGKQEYLKQTHIRTPCYGEFMHIVSEKAKIPTLRKFSNLSHNGHLIQQCAF